MRNQVVLSQFLEHLCLESPLSSWSEKEMELYIGLEPHFLRGIKGASTRLRFLWVSYADFRTNTKGVRKVDNFGSSVTY